MKRVLASILACVAIATCVRAQDVTRVPGFLGAVFAGTQSSPLVTTGDIQSNCWYFERIPSVLYTTSFAEYTTMAYYTYMKVSAGQTYRFKANYDDYAYVKVGADVLLQGECCGSVREGAYQAVSDGWVRLEIRVANAGGPAGTANGQCGVVYSLDDGTTWNRFAAAEDGLFMVPEDEVPTDIIDDKLFEYSLLSSSSVSVKLRSGVGSGVVEVPANVRGIPVTRVDFSALNDNNDECLRGVILPETVEKIDWFGWRVFSMGMLVFRSGPLGSLLNSDYRALDEAYVPHATGAEWFHSDLGSAAYPLCFSGFSDEREFIRVEILSSKMRENDPTIMDTVYKVISTNEFVNVRVLAFEDGERDFSKVVRPETFVEGTEAGVGDHVAANVEHTVSWRVSSDWKVPLAHVKFDVMARSEGRDLLYLEVMDVPPLPGHEGFSVSWLPVAPYRILDALFWLYADHDSSLSLDDGILRNGNVVLYPFPSNSRDWKRCLADDSYARWNYPLEAFDFVVTKMGYSVLSGDDLAYARDLLRLILPNGLIVKKPLVNP